MGDVPVVSSRGIFLSYRREDAAPYARLLQFQLSERLPNARVFIDLDSIEAGLDFAEVIREAVDSCAVLIALIGRQWATLTDEEGRRRLDNRDDLVRFEVQAALERGVRVIPVLVDGARPPRQQQLPPELQKLARLNALELSYGRYEYDADRLLNLIQRVLDEASGTGILHQSPSPPAAIRAIIEVTDETFNIEVTERSRTTPVIIDLWAEWCGPCKQLSPVLEKLAAEAGGRWILAKVDVDANPELCKALRVQTIPRVEAVLGGQLVDGFTGAKSEAQVGLWISQVLERTEKSVLFVVNKSLTASGPIPHCVR
jgi:thioredoxin